MGNEAQNTQNYLMLHFLATYLRHQPGQAIELRENRSKAAAPPNLFGFLQALLPVKAGVSHSQEFWNRTPKLETELF